MNRAFQDFEKRQNTRIEEYIRNRSIRELRQYQKVKINQSFNLNRQSLQVSSPYEAPKEKQELSPESMLKALTAINGKTPRPVSGIERKRQEVKRRNFQTKLEQVINNILLQMKKSEIILAKHHQISIKNLKRKQLFNKMTNLKQYIDISLSSHNILEETQ